MIILIMLFNILMASTFTFSKAALWYISPLTLITVRFLTSGALLLAYLYKTDRKSLSVPMEDWHLFFFIMLIPFYGSFIFDNWSLQFISSSKSCLIYNLMPLLTALIAYIGFRKKISHLQWTTLFFGFAFLLPVLESEGETSLLVELFDNFPVPYIPEAALIISVALAAWGWLLIQHLLLNKKYSLLLVNGVCLFGAGLLGMFHMIVYSIIAAVPTFAVTLIIPPILNGVALSLNTQKKIKEKYLALIKLIVGLMVIIGIIHLGKWLLFPEVSSPTQVYSWQPNEHDYLFKMISTLLPMNISYWVMLCLYVGWLVVGCHIIGYTLYGYLLKRYSATLLAFAGSTIPLIAFGLGHVFLGESLPKGFILSFIGITTSLLIFYSKDQNAKEG